MYVYVYAVCCIYVWDHERSPVNSFFAVTVRDFLPTPAPRLFLSFGPVAVSPHCPWPCILRRITYPIYYIVSLYLIAVCRLPYSSYSYSLLSPVYYFSLSSVLSTCLFPPSILSLSSMLFARVKYRCFNALHWVADFVMICLSSPLFPVSVQMSNQLAQCVDRSVTQSLPSRARPPLLLPNIPFFPLPFVCPFIRV